MAVSCLTYQPMVPCYEKLTFSVVLPPPSFPDLDDDDEPMAAQVLDDNEIETSTPDQKTTKSGHAELTFSVILPPPSFPNLDDDDDDEPMAAQVLDDNEIETSTPDQKTTKSGHAELTFSVILPPPSFPNLDDDDDDEPMAAQLVLGGRSPSLFSPRKRKFSEVFSVDEAETNLLRNTKKPRLAGPDVATVVETQEEVVPKTKRRPWTSVPKESKDKKQHAPMDARSIIKAMRSKKDNLSWD